MSIFDTPQKRGKKGGCPVCGEPNTMQVRITAVEGARQIRGARTLSSGRAFCQDHGEYVWHSVTDELAKLARPEKAS
jgi:hypothetical protein